MVRHLEVPVARGDRGLWGACVSARCCAGCEAGLVILLLVGGGNWEKVIRLRVPVVAAGRGVRETFTLA